MMSKER